MRKFKLDARLQTCADLVTDGARIVDVGTDHAYLPVWLAMHGKVRSAIACDINSLPLESAKANAKKYRVDHIVRIVKSDGLSEISQNDVDEIIISGMGGELIADIVSKTPWIKSCKKRLILQPMSSESDLRVYLMRNGFMLTGEKAVNAGGRIYTVISAVCADEIKEFPLEFPYVGLIAENLNNASVEYIKRQIRDLSNRAKGAQTCGNIYLLADIMCIIRKLWSIINIHGGD